MKKFIAQTIKSSCKRPIQSPRRYLMGWYFNLQKVMDHCCVQEDTWWSTEIYIKILRKLLDWDNMHALYCKILHVVQYANKCKEATMVIYWTKLWGVLFFALTFHIFVILSSLSYLASYLKSIFIIILRKIQIQLVNVTKSLLYFKMYPWVVLKSDFLYVYHRHLPTV